MSTNPAADRLHQAGVGRLQAEIAELRRSRRRIVEAATADRQSLERAVHDGLQQQLAALTIDLRRLAGLMDGESAAAKALLDEITANLRDALTEATTLAHLIHPPLLAGRGLAAALRSAAEDAGVTVLVDARSDGDYPAGYRAVLYWTCVEALSSALPGTEANVSVRAEKGRLAFEIAISGRHRSSRIQRLRDRIEAFDGRLSAETVAGGSRVHGWLPLSR